ncbi:MAG: HD-GYP domain-containing protein [Clostridia bacterium]|nr:HD-GYP domain-containing protein [Clostridia bacterium]
MQPGVIFGMRPEPGWGALEAMIVLSGRVRLAGGEELLPGDSISAHPVAEPVVLEALQPSSILYVASQPVFHGYSTELQDLLGLATEVETKDGYTKEHCARIQRLALAVGRALGLGPTDLYALSYGSFLHDVGKVRVPSTILGKPGPLTADEWEVMRRHPEFGAEIVGGRAYLRAAADIVLQHHERVDGSGYPAGRGGEAIVLGARIVAVADAFDAMTSRRPYRGPMPVEVALAELSRLAGSAYDRSVIEAFRSVVLEGARRRTPARAARGRRQKEPKGREVIA